MQTLKRQLIKLYNWRYFPFVILTLGMLLIHKNIVLGWGDDVYFSKALSHSNLNPIPFLRERYETWSSRVILESFLIVLVHIHKLWKILDTIIMLIIALCISKLVPSMDTRRSNWILTCIMFMYPLSHMNSAGWIATTLNYAWPLAFGLCSMIPIKKICYNEKIRWYEYILYSVSLIIAANQEQMCAVILAVYLVFLIYFILNKKPKWFMCLQILLCIASMIFILKCPGNYGRKTNEIATWFPDYLSVSFLRKIEMGVSSSLFEFIMKPNVLFTVFGGCLLICVIITNKNRTFRWIGSIPFAASIVFGLLSSVFDKIFPVVHFANSSMTTYGTQIKMYSVKSWIPDIIIGVVFLSIIFSLYIIFEDKKVSLLTIFIILVGLGSRIIMAFSPTIWASGLRTFIFMYFAFVVCMAILYQFILSSKEKKYTIFSDNIIYFIGVLSFLSLF